MDHEPPAKLRTKSNSNYAIEFFVQVQRTLIVLHENMRNVKRFLICVAIACLLRQRLSTSSCLKTQGRLRGFY